MSSNFKNLYISNKQHYLKLNSVNISHNYIFTKINYKDNKSINFMRGGGCGNSNDNDNNDTNGSCGGKSYE